MNIVPEQLKEFLKKSMDYVINDAEHHLLLGFRQKIWTFFGPKLDVVMPESKKAHKNRAYLALSCFKKVLPFWENKWPQDNLANNIYVEIEDIILEKITMPEFRLQELMTEVDNKGVNDNAEGLELAVGYCGFAAMEVATFDENFNENSTNILQKESFDFFEQDTAFLAEKIYSKGEED